MLPNILTRLLHKAAYLAPGGATVRPWLHRLCGSSIGRNVFIAQSVYIDDLHPENLSIGDNSTIGLRTSIITHLYWGPRRAKGNSRVTIGKDVFLGPHCVILPNSRIGDGSVIKAGTVVSGTVPPHSVWGQLPAGALGLAAVPLTAETGYEQFVLGCRPARR